MKQVSDSTVQELKEAAIAAVEFKQEANTALRASGVELPVFSSAGVGTGAGGEGEAVVAGLVSVTGQNAATPRLGHVRRMSDLFTKRCTTALSGNTANDDVSRSHVAPHL